MAEPSYRLIALELRRQIQTGKLSAGQQLPTEPELREEHGASRNTIRDAIKWLTSNGLVETRPGQGTFVVDPPRPFVTTLSADPETGLGGGEGDAAFSEVRERSREPSATVPKVEVQVAKGNVAARLRVPVGTQVVSRHQERFIDGKPWSLQTTYFPMDLILSGAPELIAAKDIKGGTVAYLKETLDLDQVGYRDRILVGSPNEQEARFFELPDDGRISVITMIRTGYRSSNEGPVPFRVTFTVFPADRNQLVINSGETPTTRAAPATPPVAAALLAQLPLPEPDEDEPEAAEP
jgi:GntR family transcriptional regulator